MSYAVIAENEESMWHDVTGVSYHFPRKYKRVLVPGTKVIYYKGVLRKSVFRDKRLSDQAHYFATARIGQIYADATSSKGDRFAEIREFRLFQQAVGIRHEGVLIEVIPENRQAFYWRDGVRPMSEDVYRRIVSLANFTDEIGATLVTDRDQVLPDTLAPKSEGAPTLHLTTRYERDPRLREAAIQIHGTTCSACGFNFAMVYGQHGAGYIQVHHVQPLADGAGEHLVDPNSDMDVLCANCHVMVHRYRDRTITVKELKQFLRENCLYNG